MRTDSPDSLNSSANVQLARRGGGNRPRAGRGSRYARDLLLRGHSEVCAAMAHPFLHLREQTKASQCLEKFLRALGIMLRCVPNHPIKVGPSDAIISGEVSKVLYLGTNAVQLEARVRNGARPNVFGRSCLLRGSPHTHSGWNRFFFAYCRKGAGCVGRDEGARFWLSSIACSINPGRPHRSVTRSFGGATRA